MSYIAKGESYMKHEKEYEIERMHLMDQIEKFNAFARELGEEEIVIKSISEKIAPAEKEKELKKLRDEFKKHYFTFEFEVKDFLKELGFIRVTTYRNGCISMFRNGSGIIAMVNGTNVQFH